MQKFAVFNERLMLGNGLLVSPLNEPNAPQQRSMRELVMQIDNQHDFQSYIRSFGAKIPQRSGEIEYKKHPVSSLFELARVIALFRANNQHLLVPDMGANN